MDIQFQVTIKWKYECSHFCNNKNLTPEEHLIVQTPLKMHWSKKIISSTDLKVVIKD